MEGLPPSTASNSGVTTKGAELPPLWMGLWERGRASLLGVLSHPLSFLSLDPLAGCMNLLWAPGLPPQAPRAGEPHRVDPSPRVVGVVGLGSGCAVLALQVRSGPLGLCWSP